MNKISPPAFEASAVPATAFPAWARRPFFAMLALAAAGALWHVAPSFAAEAAVVIPPPAQDIAASSPSSAGAAASAAGTDTAVIAGGCFWGVQGVFQHVKGVTSAVSGYAGGGANTAKYEIVGSGATGHAESVRITYDPKVISYGHLLQIYFSVAHNPTELNRQGPDSGTQYRSTIFTANAEQERVAKAYIAQLDKSKAFGRPIATTVESLKGFYPAEAYHQDYLTLNPNQPYIAINDLPKIDNLKKVFPDSYRVKPVLVGTGA